jgi:hypothetical protein
MGTPHCRPAALGPVRKVIGNDQISAAAALDGAVGLL